MQPILSRLFSERREVRGDQSAERRAATFGKERARPNHTPQKSPLETTQGRQQNQSKICTCIVPNFPRYPFPSCRPVTFYPNVVFICALVPVIVLKPPPTVTPPRACRSLGVEVVGFEDEGGLEEGWLKAGWEQELWKFRWQGELSGVFFYSCPRSPAGRGQPADECQRILLSRRMILSFLIRALIVIVADCSEPKRRLKTNFQVFPNHHSFQSPSFSPTLHDHVRLLPGYVRLPLLSSSSLPPSLLRRGLSRAQQGEVREEFNPEKTPH